MRTKEEILDDAGVSSIGMMSELELEVLIDVRDQFVVFNGEVRSIHDRLIDINSNLSFGGKQNV